MNNRSIGTILICIWLICVGAVSLLHLTFDAIGIVLGILAIASGILILWGK